MVDPKESRFWQATLLSGLMDVRSLTSCWEAIPLQKREAGDNLDRRLAREAVQSRALTVWQAQQLLAGRSNGYKIDRYTLLDLIGQGGMGRVYLAHDSRLSRHVALKVLSPERVSNPRAIARFQREARVGAKLQHENLVRIYDFGESSGRFFLVMEYIDGKTIGTLISENGRLTPALAARLTEQVAEGLEHARLKGLIHRDVNPYNILVTRDGTAKLADLGLAIDLSEGDHVTREGATVGTFDYVAPEQARDSRAADIRSDIYALGCSFYHMCSGQVPFPSSSLPEKLFAHQTSEPKPLDQLIPGFPRGLAAVIQRMIRKAPDERYATPLEVVQALAPFTERLVTPGSLESKPTINGVGPISLGLTESVASSTLGESEGTVCSPSSNDQRSDGEFPLFVDTGPEPLLSEGLTRPKVKSSLDDSSSFGHLTGRTKRLTPLSLWGLAIATTTLMILVGAFALLSARGTLSRGASVSLNSIADDKVKPQIAAEHSATLSKIEPVIFVRVDGENEQGFPAGKLLEAMQTAMGCRGSVELQNPEPIHLTSDQFLNFTTARGHLVIRASRGFHPVLDVELKGSKPFLATGSGVGLELSGLTFNVSYSQMHKPSTMPALIVAAGSAKIERCAFRVTGGHHPQGSRALISNGGLLEINRSWFQNFDEAINIVSMNSTPARIRQTMIVQNTRLDQNETEMTDWYGWAVKLQPAMRPKSTKKNALPQLILEKCTVHGAGLIDLLISDDRSMPGIEVNRCAIKAEALLACRCLPKASIPMNWRGVGNQYDILGRSWFVLSANQGTPAFSNTVTDLQSWLRFAPGERTPIHDRITFLTNPSEDSEKVRPLDFKIQALVAAQARPGADSELVGPWSEP